MIKNTEDNKIKAECCVETLEAELAEATAKRDALRGELAEISRFMDRARDASGAEIWKIDLQGMKMGYGMDCCRYSLEEHFHPEDMRVFLEKAPALRCDQPEIRIELRIRGHQENWERFRFCGRAETFDADGHPTLLVGVKTNISNQIKINPPVSQEQIREILDNSFVVFYWLDMSGAGNIYTSPAIDEYFLSSRELSFERMLELGFETLHPDDKPRMEADIGLILSKKSSHPVRSIFTYRRRNLRGEYHWFCDTMTLIPDREGVFRTMLGSAIDITGQKEAESALRTAEQHYRLLTRLSYAVIWSSGLDMQFNYCSPSIIDLLDYTPEEVVKLGPQVTLLPESIWKVGELIRDALEKEAKEPGIVVPLQFEIWQRHKSGRSVLTEVAASMMRDGSGRLIGFCGATRDITEANQMKETLKKSREELEKNVLLRTEELARANENLRQEIERRRQVESALLEMSESEQRSIGHDMHDGLCQQLAGIMCLCQAARERLLEIGSIDAIQMGRIHEFLGAVVRYARNMARGLSPVFADAGGLCTALEALAASAATMFKVTCHFLRSGNSLVWDPGQALSLYRIAREAIQSSIQNGKAERIDIFLKTSSKRVCLVVNDDGCSRAAATLETPNYGLWMIDYRMRAMGGVIRMKSLRGGGMTVRCIAPLICQEKGGENASIE